MLFVAPDRAFSGQFLFCWEVFRYEKEVGARNAVSRECFAIFQIGNVPIQPYAIFSYSIKLLSPFSL